MSKKRIVLLIVSALLIIFGIYTMNLSDEGPGDIEVYTGKLTMLEGAEDSDFGIKVDSPILIRKVEMYQYYKFNEKLRKDFFDKHHPQVKM